MSTTDQNATIDAGDGVTFDVAVTDDETGLALDLTGASVRWGLSAKAGDAVPLIVKSSPAGGVSIGNPAGGLFAVTIAPADTVALAGRYHHEAEVTLGGVPITVLRGTVTIRPTVLK